MRGFATIRLVPHAIEQLIGRVAAIGGAGHAPGEHSEVEINRVVSAAATTYEKIRYLLENRDEHTIRRSAIERILRRRIMIERKAVDTTLLLRELVEGRYIDTDQAGEHDASEVQHIIDAFGAIDVGSGEAHTRQLVSFAASEVEAYLDTAQHDADASVVDAMYQLLRPTVRVRGVEESVIDTQFYCACRRALLNSDDEGLAYALWLAYVPGWRERSFEGEALTHGLRAILDAIRSDVKDSLQWQLAARLKTQSIYFRIVREAIREKGNGAADVLSDPVRMADYARTFLRQVYAEERTRMRGAGIRAVLYLICTKLILTLAIEVPYDVVILGGIRMVPLLVNIIFHPALLYLLTREPGQLGSRNTEAVIHGMESMLYHGESPTIEVGGTRPFGAFFAVLYLVLIAGVFGGIVGILQGLDFTIVGGALFLFFLALVAYLAFRIRLRAQRWIVLEETGVLGLMTNALLVPIVHVGRWLARSFSSINVFVLFMDFIIETPFKLLLNVSHHFLIYLREKGNEVY